MIGHVSFVLSGSQKCNGFPSAKETTRLSCSAPFKVIDIGSKVIKGPLNEMHQMCMECTWQDFLLNFQNSEFSPIS